MCRLYLYLVHCIAFLKAIIELSDIIITSKRHYAYKANKKLKLEIPIVEHLKPPFSHTFARSWNIDPRWFPPTGSCRKACARPEIDFRTSHCSRSWWTSGRSKEFRRWIRKDCNRRPSLNFQFQAHWESKIKFSLNKLLFKEWKKAQNFKFKLFN